MFHIIVKDKYLILFATTFFYKNHNIGTYRDRQEGLILTLDPLMPDVQPQVEHVSIFESQRAALNARDRLFGDYQHQHYGANA